MSEPADDVFSRHPRLTIAAVLLVGTLLVLGVAELVLRSSGGVDVNYYTGYTTPGVRRFPYGEIPVNSVGQPDEEFEPANGRRHVGYFGDSVALGVGAGYGYRIPDLLQKRFVDRDHWVFAQVDSYLVPEIVIDQVKASRLASVVYLMNLNDVVPPPERVVGYQVEAPTTWVGRLRDGPLGGIDAALRGRSYVYTHLRLGFKNLMQRRGVEASGMRALELEPGRNAAVYASTAARVADALDAARAAGLERACVVVLPYEMQVSADAARRYRELGFSWEPGFEQGSAQRALLEAFAARGVRAFDARAAFAGRELAVGESFVYDRGDKIDWNHPNRLGHALIAAWLERDPGFVSDCL